jgi:hypothetical protein
MKNNTGNSLDTVYYHQTQGSIKYEQTAPTEIKGHSVGELKAMNKKRNKRDT